MKNDRALREKLARAGDLRVVIPYPKGPRGGTSQKAMLRGMARRYHIDIDFDRESDYYEDLFYNADLRSIMGHVEEWLDNLVLIVNGQWYAGGSDYAGKWSYDEGFGETYWKNLLDDAISVEICE